MTLDQIRSEYNKSHPDYNDPIIVGFAYRMAQLSRQETLTEVKEALAKLQDKKQ